jgi:hypothetical protein
LSAALPNHRARTTIRPSPPWRRTPVLARQLFLLMRLSGFNSCYLCSLGIKGSPPRDPNIEASIGPEIR